jgi:hypothetical protein
MPGWGYWPRRAGRAKVARGVAAGAAAAMLPAFGLHIFFAAAFAWILRGSLPVAGATCLAMGNPLTHLLLVPAECGLAAAARPGPGAAERAGLAGGALPVAEEALAGGLVFAVGRGWPPAGPPIVPWPRTAPPRIRMSGPLAGRGGAPRSLSLFRGQTALASHQDSTGPCPGRIRARSRPGPYLRFGPASFRNAGGPARVATTASL